MLLVWVELAAAADLPVGPTQTYTSIADAVGAASNGDVVVVDAGTYVEPAIQVGGKSLTIRSADGPGTVFVEASAGAPWYRMNGNSSLVLEGLDIDALGQRRIVTGMNGDLTVIDSVLSNGSAVGDGGLIEVGGTVTITGSRLEGGTATGNGGLLRASAATTITDSELIGGTAVQGSAIAITAGALVISGTRIADNTGTTGTVYCDTPAGCSLTGVAFEGNQAGRGAAVSFVRSAAHVLDGTTLCANTGTGGLVDVLAGSLSMDGLILFDNTVDTGGLAFSAGTTSTLVNAHLVANTASVSAAALDVRGDLTLTNAVVAYNLQPDAAITVAAGGSMLGAYNVYWQNDVFGINQQTSATEFIADPLLVGATRGTCDFTQLGPYSNSPIIDGGDPALTDLDGTRSDIGAFGTSTPIPPVDPVDPIDDDMDGVQIPADCDDANPDVFPGAVEIPCNGIDEDCDTNNTPDDSDFDGDGVSVCQLDCDDGNPAVFPGNPEVQCNGLDDDCDPGTIDDGDLDGDGVSQCQLDCDDGNPAVFPGAAEVRCTGVDEDCDPSTPDDVDEDGDGVSQCQLDCDDQVATVFPGAAEVPYDGIDQDCSGQDLVDVDGDGAPISRDCNDEDPLIKPSSMDIPGDGIDQDCTGFDAETTLVGRYGLRCGCSGTGGAASPVLLLLGLVLARRRR
ncbi:MAG: putative metal-binding motif-containing protein [Myxococcota bacterium]